MIKGHPGQVGISSPGKHTAQTADYSYLLSSNKRHNTTSQTFPELICTGVIKKTLKALVEED